MHDSVRLFQKLALGALVIFGPVDLEKDVPHTSWSRRRLGKMLSRIAVKSPQIMKRRMRRMKRLYFI
jgi:hypothetical protein